MLSWTGTVVLVLLMKNFCAGDDVIPVEGVFLCADSPKKKSVPVCSVFFIKFLMTFTAFSALPFAYWWYGDDLV